mgnify:FL=1
MVQLKDVIVGLFSKYYWGVMLVLGLVGLLFLVVAPNTEYIMTRLGFETKTSLREERDKLIENVNLLQSVNQRNSTEIALLKDRYEKQLALVQSNHEERIVIQEKVRVIKEKIPIPKKNALSNEEASVYYNALNEAHTLANGAS